MFRVHLYNVGLECNQPSLDVSGPFRSHLLTPRHHHLLLHPQNTFDTFALIITAAVVTMATAMVTLQQASGHGHV